MNPRPNKLLRSGSFGLSMLLFAGCLKGPSFMKQAGPADSRRATLKPVYVASIEQADGSTSGSLSAASNTTQILKASEASAISGAAVEFPPGSLAIDTEITMKAGATVASPETLKSLELETAVTSSAT